MNYLTSMSVNTSAVLPSADTTPHLTPCYRVYREADLISQPDVCNDLNSFATSQLIVSHLLRFPPQSPSQAIQISHSADDSSKMSPVLPVTKSPTSIEVGMAKVLFSRLHNFKTQRLPPLPASAIGGSNIGSVTFD